MTDSDLSNSIKAIILGLCYANQTEPVRIEFANVAHTYFDDETIADKIAYSFDWLEREGFVRCLNKRKSSCVQAEITSKGIRLLRQNDTGERLASAVKEGAISLAAKLILTIFETM